MCIFTTIRHTCGHTLILSPLPCPIYTAYYSSISVLDLASALISSAHECPFVHREAVHSLLPCSACIAKHHFAVDSNVEGENEKRRGSGSDSDSRTSLSAASIYSDLHTLKLLEAEAFMRTQQKSALSRVVAWKGWARLNRWQKKVRRGGFGGQNVRRKAVRSSISDVDVDIGI